MGRGPVDFKLSNGSKVRLLIEVKKLHNGKFWDGLGAQLPTYLESDQCRNGWLLTVRYRHGGISEQRQKELPQRVADLASDLGMQLGLTLVDARRPLSASKLKR
jgi:hypothetical protein